MHNQAMTPLKLARVSSRKTLKDVADALDVDMSHLSRVERAQLQASPKLAERLANYFKRAVTEEEILYPERFMRASSKGARPAVR